MQEVLIYSCDVHNHAAWVCFCAGTPEEMVCPGGELAFVTQMVKDSIKLQGRIHWYTSMVGKKATLKQLRRLLHNSRVTALRSTEFVQVSTSTFVFHTQCLQVRCIQRCETCTAASNDRHAQCFSTWIAFICLMFRVVKHAMSL